LCRNNDQSGHSLTTALRWQIAIAARLVADLLVTAGAKRVLTMTLHAPQVHGFFSVPTDHLNGKRE